MQTDLVGRVNNYRLANSKGLLPLFEAVVNSIHSIEESKRKQGEINIYIERSGQKNLLDDSNFLEPIKNFVIKDNGVGFDETHFNSFKTSDTTFKVDKGGKGIGRFSWLKAFEYVEIESLFQQDESLYKRKFDFRLSSQGVVNDSLNIVDIENVETSVKLIGFKENYRSKSPKTAAVIANRIIEHCLDYFIGDNAPLIRLIDEQANEEIVLNDIFKQEIKVHSSKQAFTCKDQSFNLVSLRLYSSGDDSEHKLCFVANKREVESERISLSKRISHLKGKVQDDSGKSFVYMAYVSGKYLDDRVNAERTEFDIARERLELDFNDISWEDILSGALSEVESYLRPYLMGLAEESYTRTVSYICRRPQFRLLLSYREERLKQIASGLTEQQLEIELYKLYMELELEIKKRSIELLDNIDDVDDLQLKKDEYIQFIEESNALGKSKLVEYVVHRKVILELLEKMLFSGADGKYSREEKIHEIVFPMRKTSDEVPYEQQNLWIIDEKLSYHQFLASDLPIKSYQGTSSQSQKEPDIAIFQSDSESIFDLPLAFIGEQYPYSSVVIIEFKRPMRSGYSDDDNPIQQVYEYVQLIREGRATDKHGGQILVDENTPFYAYIICSITPKIKNFASMIPLTLSPGGDGYFGYNAFYKTYIEIISFQKLVADAKKRNAVLFDKLNLRAL